MSDERIHYECGLPWMDHDRTFKGEAVCPDDPQGKLGKLDRVRPAGHPEPGPDDDDGEEATGPRYVGPDMDELFTDWVDESWRKELERDDCE